MTNNTYNQQSNIFVRDVQDILNTVIVNNPVASLLLRDLWVMATSTKHERYDDVSKVNRLNISAVSVYSEWDKQTLTLPTAVTMEVGSIRDVQTDTFGTKRFQIELTTAVENSTSIPATSYNMLGTQVEIEVGDTLLFLSNPRDENSTPWASIQNEPTNRFNYTEIFDVTYGLSRTQEVVEKYNNANSWAYYAQHAYFKILRQLLNQAIYGKKRARTGSALNQRGRMWGVIEALDEMPASNIIDKNNAAFTKTDLNNLFEQSMVWGSNGVDIILCHPKQARKITAFNDAAMQVTRTDNVAGFSVQQFESDLWQLVSIVKDASFPTNIVSLHNSSTMWLVPLRTLIDEDARQNQDGDLRRLLWEYTYCVRNIDTDHFMLNNVA